MGQPSRRALRVLIGVATLGACFTAHPPATAATATAGAWTRLADMPAPRSEPFALPIPGDRMFVIGDSRDSARARAAEIYDASTDTWTSAGSPAGQHDNMLSAGQLADGRILVVGGYDSRAADLWDPATGAWTALPPMTGRKHTSRVTGLADGRALVLGADNYGYSPEIFDPATSSWAPLPAGLIPYPNNAAQLGDGRVLLLGGRTTALWDPSTGSWTAAGDYPEPFHPGGIYFGPGAMRVTGGVVVAVGGYGDMARRTFKFDPVTLAWVELGNLHADFHRGSPLATLPGGSILAVGGCCTYTADTANGEIRAAEILDLATGTWSPTAARTLSRGQLALGVVGGRVLAIGGAIPSADAYGPSIPTAAVEAFDPSTPPPAEDLTVSARGVDAYPKIPGTQYVSAAAFDRATYVSTAGAPVRLEVTAGGPTPAGTLLTCTPACVTDKYGRITGALENNLAAGTDTVRAHVDVNGNGVVDGAEPTATTTLAWPVRTTRLSVESPGTIERKPEFVARLEWLYGKECGGYTYNCWDAYASVRGRRVNFYNAGSSKLVCSATTNANGAAACGTILDKLLAIHAGGVRAEFVGDDLYTPSNAEATA